MFIAIKYFKEPHFKSSKTSALPFLVFTRPPAFQKLQKKGGGECEREVLCDAVWGKAGMGGGGGHREMLIVIFRDVFF